MSGINQLRIFISFFILFSLQHKLYAQNEISSPYSAFGLGNLSNINSIKNISMGSVGIGTRESSAININNPASYTAFDTASFLFEGGISGSYTQMKTEKVNETFTTASISQLTFGFPINRWWKSSIGMVPFSKVGYIITDQIYQENVGNVAYSFEGTGGLSRVYWGNAFQPFEFLSIGVNASYLFGSINRIQKVTFPDSSYYLNTRIDNTTNLGDLLLEFGVQYFTQLKKDIKLVAGITYRPQTNINAKKEYLARSSLGEISNVEFFRDTIAFTNEKGQVILPSGFGTGFSLSKTNQWFVGVDYRADQWEKYRNFGASDSLINSQVFSFGGYFIPDFAANSYLKRMEYRVGGRYSESYLKLREKQINGFGITFGFGLPLRSIALKGSKSMINIGAEIGKRGTMENGLIQENYANFYFGISIYEFWFYKRRYK